MQIHTVLDNAEVVLAEIGGEVLAGSGFENELPDADFASEDVGTLIAANQRED